jgi:hypothetical protein
MVLGYAVFQVRASPGAIRKGGCFDKMVASKKEL